MSVTVEQLLAAASTDEAVLSSLGELLTSDLSVPNPLYRMVAKFMVEFVAKHSVLPRPGDYGLWIDSLQESQRAGVTSSLFEIQRQDVSGFTLDFLVAVGAQELQNTAARTALVRAGSIPQVTSETLKLLHEEVERLRPVDLTGLADIRDVDLWIQPDPRVEAIPTGIVGIDRTLDGGFRQELILVMADTGVGKTIFLTNLGSQFVLYGKTVLMITFEIYTRPLIHRWYRRMAEVDKSTLRNSTETVVSRLHHWFRFAHGSAHILYMDPYTHTPEDVQRVVDRFVKRFGKLDALILDYMDLMLAPKDTRALREDSQLSVMTHQTRAFCPRYGCTTISAAQSTREANSGGQLRLTHMSGAYGKNRGADVVIGLAQSDDEAAVFQARASMLKIRESEGKGRTLPLYYDADLMLFTDLDSPDARRILRERHPEVLERVAGPNAESPQGTLI